VPNKREKVPSRRDEDKLALDVTMVDDSGANLLGAPHAALIATTTMMDDGGGRARTEDAMPQQTVAAFSEGYVLSGRYRIRGRIGKGAFGFVYSAEDLELDVVVAIKVLRPEVDGNHAMIRRFKQEIQLARQVTHENVCRIFDVGFYEFGDLRVPFLSMELLVGESLSERHKRMGALPWRELEGITQQVALGLQAAHRVGVVHADLKPANIMLVGQGTDTRAVITDFGLASTHATDAETSNGAIVGTPAYMAPEQARGEDLTPASDFYALGCTLFHVISGQLPFVAASALSTAKARLQGPIPKLRASREPMPAKWSALVHDLLVRDPEGRISDAAEVRRRLHPASKRWPVVAAVAIAMCVALLAVFALRGEGAAPVERQGPFVRSLPPAGPALKQYEEGLRQWRALDSAAAVKTWEAAIDNGLGHPRTYERLCKGLTFFNRINEADACWQQVSTAASALPRDERDYYLAESGKQAGKLVESARLLSRLLQRYPGNHDVVLMLAEVHRMEMEFDEALRTLDADQPTSKREELETSAMRIWFLAQNKKYAMAVEGATVPLQQTHELGFTRLELRLLSSVGQSHHNMGHLQETRDVGERSLLLAKRIGSLSDEAEAAALLVAVAIKEHKYAKAEILADRQLHLLMAIRNDSSVNRMLITKSEILLVTGRPMKADALLTNEVIPRLRKSKGTYLEGYALVTRAEVRRSLGRGAEALDDCYAGKAIFQGLRSVRMQAYATMVCGHVLLDLGRVDEAEEELAEAYEKRVALHLNLQLLQNELSRAELALARDNGAKAHEIAADVASRYHERGLQMDEMIAREIMTRAALAMGDDARAAQDFAPLKNLARGEDEELNLNIELLAARMALRNEPSRANRAQLEGLLEKASRVGYERIATVTRNAITSEPHRQ